MNRVVFPLSALCMLLNFSALQVHAAEKSPSTAATPVKAGNDEILLSDDSPQMANLKIEAVTEIAAPATEPLNGRIILDENATTRISSPVNGRALKINVQVGDKVKSGDILMLMDSPDLGSALADARKADADLKLKRQAHERSKMLLDGGVIARKEYEASEADLAASEAESGRTRAVLHNLGANLSKINGESYAVRSPITGVVADRQINPGNEVRPDAAAPLFIVTNPSSLWATIDLPERDLGKVREGQAISVEVDAYPNEVFKGRILSIGTMLDPTTRRIQVRCTVESRNRLKPEMYARITPLSESSEKVIRVPNTALITEGLYSYVFIETSPGHIKKRRVALNTQGRDFATVKAGLKTGDRLVTSGAILLNSELAAGK